MQSRQHRSENSVFNLVYQSPKESDLKQSSFDSVISKILKTSLIDVSNVFIMESLKDFSWPLKIPPNNVKDLTRDKL